MDESCAKNYFPCSVILLSNGKNCVSANVYEYLVFSDMGKFLDVSEKMVTAESGQAAILELPYIESFPEPLVTWQTGNTSIISSKLDVITISRQLIILSVSDAHQKSYR